MLRDLDIPDEYLRAIGRIAVEWNRIEGLIEQLITRLLGREWADERCLIVLTHMPMNLRLDALRSLLDLEAKRMQSTLYLQEFRTRVLPRLTDLQKRRNAMIHHRWYSKEGVVQKGNLTAHGSLHLTNRVVTLQEVESVHAEIFALANALFLLLNGQEIPSMSRNEDNT